MNTKKLFENINYKGTLPDCEVFHITQDSRKVQQGSIFVCSKGVSSDGHKYANKAVELGAVLIVCEYSLGLKNEVIVENGRKAFALLSQNFFDNPQKKLKLIAVTGTNGKTTVTSIIKQILELQGYKCGLIGTIQCEIDKMILPSKFTTPEAWDISMLFNRMVNANCEYVVMEASSQALAQYRLYGLNFECGVFTNLSQDHLDYHITMENYFLAKAKLFDKCKNIIINIDDDYGKRLQKMFENKNIITFSANGEKAQFSAKKSLLEIGKVNYLLTKENQNYDITFSMPGKFSIANSLACIGVLTSLNIPMQNIVPSLSKCKGVKGRSEILYDKEFTIICDFAHTGDGIENILKGIKPFVKNKLIVLFGCAGERDAVKRPEMSKAVVSYANTIILTSDNPRGEDEQKIIDDALPIIENSNLEYYVEKDRAKALQIAFNLLTTGDVLVLCGKGHEDYQALNKYTIYFDEHKFVSDWINSRNI